MDGRDVRLLPRGYTLLHKVNADLIDLEKKKLIKIRIVK